MTLELADDHPVFLTGGSGSGKSTLLRAIHAVATGDLPVLSALPLSELRLERDGAADVHAKRSDDGGIWIFIGDKKFHYARGAADVLEEDERYQGGASLPKLLRMEGAVKSRAAYDALRHYFANQVRSDYPWLIEELADLSVPYIADDRLFALADQDVPSPVQSTQRRPYRHQFAPSLTSFRAIDQINIDLGEIARSRTILASRQSSRIDRLLPERVVGAVRGPDASSQQLADCLLEIDELERRARQFGLGSQGSAEATRLLRDEVASNPRDGELAVLLAVLQSYKEKLLVSQPLLDDLERFVSAVNRRFRGKHLEYSIQGGLRVVLDEDDELSRMRDEHGAIPLGALSSGEQHLVVLLYRLIFGAKKRSLFLVDEPELSLHVAWQRELASDLAEIAAHTESRYLIATHSPSVLAGHMDWEVNFDDLDDA